MDLETLSFCTFRGPSSNYFSKLDKIIEFTWFITQSKQCSAIARSIFPMFFQISPFCFDFCHFVMIFSKRKSGSFCSVALHKQPESAVLLQKSKQSWQKAKQVGDIWKNSGKILQAIEKAWARYIWSRKNSSPWWARIFF